MIPQDLSCAWCNNLDLASQNLEPRSHELATEASHATNLILAQLPLAGFPVAFKNASHLSIVMAHLMRDPVFLFDKQTPARSPIAVRVLDHILSGEHWGVAPCAHKEARLVNDETILRVRQMHHLLQ